MLPLVKKPLTILATLMVIVEVFDKIKTDLINKFFFANNHPELYGAQDCLSCQY